MPAPERPVDPRPGIDRALRLLHAVTRAHPGGEERPEQQEMTRLVAAAVLDGRPLIVQAGTGTGKSLAYLCGGLGAGAQLVVSTATRQLSDQLAAHDVPAVLEALRRLDGRVRAGAVLKGRANYVCRARVAELHALERQVAGSGGEEVPGTEELDLGLTPVERAHNAKRESELGPGSGAGMGAGGVAGVVGISRVDVASLQALLRWVAGDPGVGDRAAGPSVPDRVWGQVSTDAAGCPGASSCPFGDDCLAEAARAEARAADVVLANHALLARDLISPNPLFADRDLVVVDEVHELERYLSNAWGYGISADGIDRVVVTAVRRVPSAATDAGTVARHLTADTGAVSSALAELTPGRLSGPLPVRVDGPLASMRRHAKELADAFERIADESRAGQVPGSAVGESAGSSAAPGAIDAGRQVSRAQLLDLIEAIDAMRSDSSDLVRWVEVRPDQDRGRLWAAPLEVGLRFRRAIGDRVLVATSATAAVAGDFGPIGSTLGLDPSDPASDDLDQPDPDPDPDSDDAGWVGVDVGSPFDYRRQAILYVPRQFPAPVGRERTDHSAAVLAELTDLVSAAGGRTLALFTTAVGAHRAADHLRHALGKSAGRDISILEHGELSAEALTDEFAADETSVLCATMGMWSGLDISGPACSLVVIDKIPFAPMDDPLSSARRERADADGRSGFHEVYVTRAALMLTQGVGRLIRRRSDRGVVAILDPRLHTKRYGVDLLRSLPPMWPTSDPGVARAALVRLAADADSVDRS